MVERDKTEIDDGCTKRLTSGLLEATVTFFLFRRSVPQRRVVVLLRALYKGRTWERYLSENDSSVIPSHLNLLRSIGPLKRLHAVSKNVAKDMTLRASQTGKHCEQATSSLLKESCSAEFVGTRGTVSCSSLQSWTAEVLSDGSRAQHRQR